MFNPTRPDAILDLRDKDLSLLPIAEDDLYEYKSSATRDSDLSDKIARAASGFWNSGGGLFIAGVNGQGQADGGISISVGRQSRRDWIDQAISRVSPGARYIVHSIEDQGAGFNIISGNAIFLIGYGESEIGPHMAPDNRYYIRAGAHTVPASHFIVEAIHTRRGLRTPMLSHVVRRKPGNAGVLQLGIVALSEVPAINVSIQPDPLPKWFVEWSLYKFPLHASVISKQFPFFFDTHLLYFNEERPAFQVELSYQDLVGRQYDQVLQVDIDRQLGPSLAKEKVTEDLEKELREIKQMFGNSTLAISGRGSELIQQDLPILRMK